MKNMKRSSKLLLWLLFLVISCSTFPIYNFTKDFGKSIVATNLILNVLCYYELGKYEKLMLKDWKVSKVIEQMLPWSDKDGNTLAWSQIQGEEKNYQTYTEASDIWLSELVIPEEQYPDYDACLCWYKNAHDNSEIIIFWNPEINRLYIVEKMI